MLNTRLALTAAVMIMFTAGCNDDTSNDGDTTVRYTDRGGRAVEVDCSNATELVITDAGTGQVTLDYYQDAVEACGAAS